MSDLELGKKFQPTYFKTSLLVQNYKSFQK